MGKSLTGKELGQGITQRKDGRFQARFTNRFVLTVIGAIVLFITWLVYRKMSGKKPMKLNIKFIGKVVYGIVAALVFGLGMCMVMVFEGMMIPGIIVGIIGIVLLLCLIPMCVGLKDSKKENEQKEV